MRLPPPHTAAATTSPRKLAGRVYIDRSAFTLTELLVAVAIIVTLMSLSAVAVNAARNSQKVNQTRLTITKIDRIISEQLRRYDSRYITGLQLGSAPSGNGETATQQRAWYIRRNLINGDMPDRWADVEFVATNYTSSNPPPTMAQRNYKKLWDTGAVTREVGDRGSGECLFTIIMLGGFADCLDCGPMRSFEIGDTDSDGLPEFLDAWGNPIGFLLWAPGLEIPLGSPFFFSKEDPWPPPPTPPTPMLGMRPLIYSGGPDGVAGYNRGNEDVSSMSSGKDCGNWKVAEFGNRGTGLAIDSRRDNLTNFDEEARQ
jgi:prepilin-type N-terminal cleavage/methylation domain-containing protein